jgi:iron(III) transport system substrate-binding protein
MVLLLAFTLLGACQSKETPSEVVVYTSVDQVFSEPILNRFQEETGIRVLAVYDVEATKTTGLVNRLIAEKDHPQADVFWSGEFAQTILLQEEGVLTPYPSPQGADIPDQYRDPEGYWYGFAGRARVFLVNTDLLTPEEYPDSIYDLLDPPRSADQVGIAYPLFGTTSTHAAALYAQLGPEAAKEYFEGISVSGVRIVDGNSVVRDLVVEGQLAFGLTDTDDSCSALAKGAPVKIIFPDQQTGEMGTLIIPNTVAQIAGSPHPDEAQAFIDFLLSKEIEEAMIESGWSHISLRPLDVNQSCLEDVSIQGMAVSLNDVYRQLQLAKSDLTEIFVR